MAIAKTPFRELRRAQKFAHLVSVLLSPNVVCVFAFLWFLISYHATPFWAWMLGGVYFYGIHPLVLPLVHVARKKGDIYVTDRRQRSWPFVSAIAGYLIFLGFVGTGFGWGSLLTRVIMGSTVLSAVIAIVSLWWKISIHATGNSVAVAGLAVLSPPTLWWTLPLHALVLWARRAVKAHTVVQLLVGTALGLGVPLALIYLIP